MTPHEDAIPVETRLIELISGNGSDLFWLPKAVTDEQIAAESALNAAVREYERAFGTSNLLQQLDLLAAATRLLTKKNAAQRRILDARAEINAAAAAARRAGNEARSREIEARPTPDYPGLADDMRELGYAS